MVIAGLIAILVVAVMLYAVVAGSGNKVHQAKRQGHVDHEMVARRWIEIEQMASIGGSGIKNAIAEADKLLDYVMKQRGFKGTTMGERLKHDGHRIGNLNDVWAAHKLRNSLAHDVKFDLVNSHAREALASFKKALKNLGAL